jgi:beta-glucosidase
MSNNAASQPLQPLQPSNRVNELLKQLTLEEQVSLLAGANNWETVAIERLGIPSMRVTDGPAGARGTRFDGPASVNVPCGTALGATWDPALVQEVGVLLGREVKAKGAAIHLAPTINLHRTPIGGRNFECLSEDPYLTGAIAVGYVKGVQSEGVASCVKHFVGNDTEVERMTINSEIDERTMREMYLAPFEATVREANAKSIMTAYNRINGPYAADSKELITDVLRGEWGFDGLVMSDWFGLHSTVEGIESGLDLEMPGPAVARGQKLLDAVNDGRVSTEAIRMRAERLLMTLEDLGVLDGNGPGPELTIDEPADRALVRAAGSASMVLLRNEGNALPLSSVQGLKVAVIGPNAKIGRVMGGGSAFVTATHQVHPLEAITARLGAVGAKVTYAPGCLTHRRMPEPEATVMAPILVDIFDGVGSIDEPEARPVRTQNPPNARVTWFDSAAVGANIRNFSARARTTLTPDVSGTWTLGFTVAGEARLFVNGERVADNESQGFGGSFFGLGKDEVTVQRDLEAGKSYVIELEIRREAEFALSGFYFGALAPQTVDLVMQATDLAATSDVAIVIVGTNDEWETEGYDRDDMNLPGRQNELVAAVASVNPRTIVVVNAGSPVPMPWINEVGAALAIWFPGQELGDSLVDVLTGLVDPGGRLPVTFPNRLEDTPAVEHYPGRNGKMQYREGRLIGYRWYDTVGREPLFPFGHGMSYAHLAITSASVAGGGLGAPVVTATVANSSDRSGVEVVQVYAAAVHVPLSDDEVSKPSDQPVQKLVGFAKVPVAAGATGEIAIALDSRWNQTWDVATHAWIVRPEAMELRVGVSSRSISHVLTVK